MAAIRWIQFFIGAFLLLCGLIIFVLEIMGVYRFKYVLNRMHAAAMGDTLGIGCALIGLIVMNGFTMVSLKLLLVVVFLWFSSPVSSHLIARLEVSTDTEAEKHYRKADLKELEKELQERDREALESFPEEETAVSSVLQNESEQNLSKEREA